METMIPTLLVSTVITVFFSKLMRWRVEKLEDRVKALEATPPETK